MTTDTPTTRTTWFRDAGFGLFIHYGLYSLAGRGEWMQQRELIPVAEYAKLADRFTAEAFDAEAIVALCRAAEMRYVTLTTMHHDGFCLFDSAETDFTSVRAPAGRDLVGELADACHRAGIGLCLYYSHGRHWRHPHAMMNDRYRMARPEYTCSEPAYAWGNDHDISRYNAYCRAQVRELLTGYGPISAMWFDGWGTPFSGPWREELEIPELYALIRSIQPRCLIGYKFGLTGDEDFYAPEFRWPREHPDLWATAQASGKPIELCHHIAGWGYWPPNDGLHRGSDSILADLDTACGHGANLLLNTAPRGDGALDAQDVDSLRRVGDTLRARTAARP